MPRRHEGYVPPVLKEARPTGNFPRTGLINPADKAKLDALLYGPNGEILLGGGAFIGRHSRMAGPETDVHLRTGTGAGSTADIEAQNAVRLLSNAYSDNNVSWNRFNAAAPVLDMEVYAAGYGVYLYYAAAGANPIASFPKVAAILTDPAMRAIFESSQFDGFFMSNGDTHLTSNAWYDGWASGTWNRYNTANPAAILVVRKTGSLEFYYGAAGANPIAFTGPLTIAAPGATDANGWYRVYESDGKRVWRKRLTVSSGWPAATSWTSMATTALPTGLTNFTQVRYSKSFFASTWSRVMTIEMDATTGSTTLAFHGTLAAGPGNWNAINPTVVIDIELKEI